MKNEKLDLLVKHGLLSSYEYVNVSEAGEVGLRSEFRNAQRVKLVFTNGDTITFDTICSGCLENTNIIIS